MLDSTLVVWGGEFGRTPVSESGDGRDHNPYGFTMWVAGGGFKGGLAYGATDEFGFKAVENRVSIHDLHATLLNQMGVDHTKLTYRYAGRDFRLTDVLWRSGERHSGIRRSHSNEAYCDFSRSPSSPAAAPRRARSAVPAQPEDIQQIQEQDRANSKARSRASRPNMPIPILWAMSEVYAKAGRMLLEFPELIANQNADRSRVGRARSRHRARQGN